MARCSAIVGSLAIHGALALIIALAIHAPKPGGAEAEPLVQPVSPVVGGLVPVPA